MNAPLSRYQHSYAFDSTGEFFDFVLGPRQHDAHLDTRRKAMWLQQQRAFCDGAEKRVREWVKTL